MTNLGFLITGAGSLMFSILMVIGLILNSRTSKLTIVDALMTALTTVNIIFVLNALKYILF